MSAGKKRPGGGYRSQYASNLTQARPGDVTGSRLQIKQRTVYDSRE